MLAALRRAGSALPRHAASRMRERQSRRRCLPAEPDLPPPTLDKLADVVQTEPARRRETWPDGREGANMARGQFLTVAVIAATRQSQLQTATLACSQATSTSTEHGGEAWNGLRGSLEVTPELAELSRRPTRIHPHRLTLAPHMGVFEATARECRVELRPPIAAD